MTEMTTYTCWIFRPGEPLEKLHEKWPTPNGRYPLGTWSLTGLGYWMEWSAYKDGTPEWWQKRELEEVPKDLQMTVLLGG